MQRTDAAMSSNRNDPRCETDPALTEPWIDVLGKALAGGIPRRTALKILAGAALASVLGVTAGCGTPAYCPDSGPCQKCTTDATGSGSCQSCNEVNNLCASAATYDPYNKLYDYLVKQGFQAQGVAGARGKRDLQALHVIRAGYFDSQVLGLKFTNPSVSDQTANLYYTVSGSSISSVVAVYQTSGEGYGLYVDTDGQVKQVPAQRPQAQHAHRSSDTGREAPPVSALSSEHPGFLTETASVTITPCNIMCDVVCAVVGVACGLGCGWMCGVPSLGAGPVAPEALAVCAAACSIGGCVPPLIIWTDLCSEVLCTCHPPCDACSVCDSKTCRSICLAGTECCGSGCITTCDSSKCLACDEKTSGCKSTCNNSQKCCNSMCIPVVDQCCSSTQTKCGSDCCDPDVPCCTTVLGNPYCAVPAGSTCCGANLGACPPNTTCCAPGGELPEQCCVPGTNCCKSTDINFGCSFNPCKPRP